jgi:hypothetical protein
VEIADKEAKKKAEIEEREEVIASKQREYEELQQAL